MKICIEHNYSNVKMGELNKLRITNKHLQLRFKSLSLWIKKLLGVKIASLTSDGPPSNMAMFTELGVNFNPATLKTWFPHPLVKNEKV